MKQLLVLRLAFVILSALTNNSLARFVVEYPAPRGFNEATLNQFPCGGLNQVSTQRTLYPLTGGAIGLEMENDRTNIQVLIAFDSVATSSFNTVIRPTFTQVGQGKFCMTNVNMPANQDISEGTNATIQIVTSSDDDERGGLYSCSDIAFGISAFDFDICQNSTGVMVSNVKIKGNANETKPSESDSQNSARKIWSFDLSHKTVTAITMLLFIGNLCF